MTPPERLRALLAEPGFVVMPAVWDGLTAKLTAKAGFRTAFLSGSCVAASRLGGPDLDLLSVSEMLDSFRQVREGAPDLLVLADGDHGFGNAMNVQRTVVLCRAVAGRTAGHALTRAGRGARLQDRDLSDRHAVARRGRRRGRAGRPERRTGGGG